MTMVQEWLKNHPNFEPRLTGTPVFFIYVPKLCKYGSSVQRIFLENLKCKNQISRCDSVIKTFGKVNVGINSIIINQVHAELA